jgi:hypothetical protein
MPKISDEPMEAVQARLFKKDLDYLRAVFSNNIGVAKAVRQIVRSFVTNAQATAAMQVDTNESVAEPLSEELL